MNRFRSISLAVAAAVVASTGLTGCAGFSGASFPDASANPAQTPLGTIQGSDYGGHAPLVGAHVYVLQPSVTTAGGTSTQTATTNAYGARATSLLNATSSGNGYPTAQNTGDVGIPLSWYYETTDATGAFNITGDYTCTAGIPVYLYLYGGSPVYPSANNQFSISSVVWSGTASPYTVTLTINTTGAQNIENAYIGELFGINNSNITPNGTALTSTGGAPINGSIQYVIAGTASNPAGSGTVNTTLSTTQFSFSYTGALPTGVTLGQVYQETGTGQVTFAPYNNPAVVNLAVLGNCPNNGTLAGTGAFTGASAIKYVYVNEVSTVAAAYAFRPFTITPSTVTGYQSDCTNTYTTSTSGTTTTYNWNNATCIGTSSTNLVGLENAANLAAQLYDITGSNVSTTYAGEGHIARSATTNGYGIVPQANIDTLGNIIAACVDSANGSTIVGNTGNAGSYTVNGNYAAISAQCNTLFTAATSNAIPIGATGAGIQPFDTAMAAINIARHPAGPPYSYSSTGASTFMTNLYTLPTGNPPFAPSLASSGAGQPNDFSLAIYYTGSTLPSPNGFALSNGAESVAVDALGNAWFTTQPNKGSGAGYFFSLSPTGAYSNVNYQTSYIYGYVTIDSGNSAWSGAEINGDAAPTYVSRTGTTTSSTVYPNPYTYAAGTTNSTLVENYTTAAVADAVGNVYFANNKTAGSSTAYIETFAGAATTPTVQGTESAAIPSVNTSAQGFSHGAMTFSSTSGNQFAYFDYNASNNTGTPTVDYVSLSTTNGYTPANGSGFPVTNATTGCTAMTDIEQLATLRSGDVIVPDYHNGTGASGTTGSALYYITSPAGAGTAGSATGPGGCTQIPESSFHAGLNYPFGATVDGNDYIYVTNRGGNSISVFNAGTAGAANLASVSPSTGIEPQYVSNGALTYMMNQPLNIASSPSGTLWVTDYGNNTIIEIIGLATPTTTPLAAAATVTPVSYLGGSIGYRP